jgi:hypothetical protein
MINFDTKLKTTAEFERAFKKEDNYNSYEP